MTQNGAPSAVIDSGVVHKQEAVNDFAGGAESVLLLGEDEEHSPIAASHQQSTLVKLMVRGGKDKKKYGHACMYVCNMIAVLGPGGRTARFFFLSVQAGGLSRLGIVDWKKTECERATWLDNDWCCLMTQS